MMDSSFLVYWTARLPLELTLLLTLLYGQKYPAFLIKCLREICLTF